MYLLDALLDCTVSSMNTNSSNVGQMKMVPKAKERVCLCVFDRDGEGKGKPKEGTEIGNCSNLFVILSVVQRKGVCAVTAQMCGELTLTWKKIINKSDF